MPEPYSIYFFCRQMEKRDLRSQLPRCPKQLSLERSLRMPRNARQNFNAAVTWLQERKIYFTNPGAGHIKIGPRVNFWPAHGKAYLDGDNQCHPDRGLPALEAVLREQGYLGGPTAPTTPSRRAGPTEPTLSVIDRTAPPATPGSIQAER
jgi:hypothetical protein